MTSSEWRHMAGNGEEKARFRRLFEDHGEQVLLYFKRRTDADSAHDGAADTFLVAWRRIDEIPLEKELPWLYGVARRVLSQQRRSSGRRLNLTRKLSGLAEADAPAPDTVVLRNSEYVAVTTALERLKPRDRELLRLAVWEELPHAERDEARARRDARLERGRVVGGHEVGGLDGRCAHDGLPSCWVCLRSSK